MRLAIGRDAARLASARISADAVAQLTAHVEGTAAALDAGTGYAELGERYRHFWRLILLASENLAYQLAYNSLLKALDQYADLSRQLGGNEVADLPVHRRLERAIAAHDADEAALAAEDLTSRMLRALPAAGPL